MYLSLSLNLGKLHQLEISQLRGDQKVTYVARELHVASGLDEGAYVYLETTM